MVPERTVSAGRFREHLGEVRGSQGVSGGSRFALYCGMAKGSKVKSRRELLECFPNPAREGEGHIARDYVIEHVAEEFTSVCPKTGHPDFGEVTLRYVPDRLCVELKSLKLYYQSYRNEGIFYEAVTHRIAEDLEAVMMPKWMVVQTEWRGRGGIRSVVTVELGRDPQQNQTQPAYEDESVLDEDPVPRSRPSEDDDLDTTPPPGFKE